MESMIGLENNSDNSDHEITSTTSITDHEKTKSKKKEGKIKLMFISKHMHL